MAATFTPRNALLVARKELLDIIRDRRTLMSMIVIPLILIPVMMLGVGSLMVASIQSMENETYDVGIYGSSSIPEVTAKLHEVESIRLVEVNSDEEELKTLINEGVFSAGVINRRPVAEGEAPEVIVLGMESREASSITRKRVITAIEELADDISLKRLEAIGAPKTILKPFVITKENLASGEQMVKAGLASFLPYILILMALTGAIYPAIDMTAGEKERATLETVLASPAARSDIVIGKLLAVMVTSSISSLISLFSLVVVASFGMNSFAMEMGEVISLQFSVGTVLLSIALMLPMTALFSSLLITIAISARSSREAQSYLTPLMFLVIVPAMTSMLPGSTGTIQKAWVPVVNVSIALRDVIIGEVDWQLTIIAIVSTLLYAAVGVFLSVRMFQRESVLFKV